MTDTQEAFRVGAIEELFTKVGMADALIHARNLELAYAQSAEKIAKLEAEVEKERKFHIMEQEMRIAEEKKSAAAELSNKQLRDVLEDFARGQLQVPNFEAYVQATAKSALAQPISTEALDAYVASKLPAWQPIETAPKDGTKIIAWRKFDGGNIVWWGNEIGGRYRWQNDDAAFPNAGGYAFTHWMPLPPSPEQKG